MSIFPHREGEDAERIVHQLAGLNEVADELRRAAADYARAAKWQSLLGITFSAIAALATLVYAGAFIWTIRHPQPPAPITVTIQQPVKSK